ncbi:immunity protein YezG family protein [Micromonospora sp. WMMC415]|uniref:immunity protein YezG family protein n=1 Tax=Micromonospora sp. WMMC415 TaxID=2675222 RepID=UPI0018AF9659|nr:immunity protein YezG family protein [Micromonospora sp. WMMC415]
MPDGRDSDIITRIGQILLSVLPDNAETIIVNGETDVDYANASLELRGPDGKAFYFAWDDNPDEAVDEITDLLIDLRQVMIDDGSDPWYGFTMAVQRDGAFEVDFSYEPPTD